MKKLLIVVDYQNDFISGSLGFPGAEKIEGKIASLIDQFEANKDDIIFTFDTHDEQYMDSVEGKRLPILHCIKNTPGNELPKSIKDRVKNYPTISKNQFGTIELSDYIKNNDYEEIYLCGLVSDICVFSNAVIAKNSASIFTRVFVVRDATSSNDPEMQEKSFDMLKHLHIDVI